MEIDEVRGGQPVAHSVFIAGLNRELVKEWHNGVKRRFG